MRVVAVGCEYTGVTTLLEGLMAWGAERGIKFHLDDHFTIPDSQHLSVEDSKMMLNLTPTLKERFQRMQVVYHIRLMHRFEHILLGGFHLEEEVYGPLYYYPNLRVHGTREYEAEMPEDTILVHLTARPEVIQARMERTPHEYTLVQSGDIPKVLERFRQEVAGSWIKHKIHIDTSELRAEELAPTFLKAARPHLNTRDLLTLLAEKVDL
jgi:hypothetical protein